jgi:hypothetical protein
MAKKRINIKKIIQKNGVVRYFKDGRFISNSIGRRLWVKQNQNLSEDKFTDKEKKNLRALKQYQKNYKFKGVANVPYAIVDLLHQLNIIDKDNLKNNDLANATNSSGKKLFKDYNEVLDLFKKKLSEISFQWVNEKGLEDYRGRTEVQSIVDILNLLDSPNYKYYKFIVIDPEGRQHSGRVKGSVALSEFETMVTTIVKDGIDNSAYVKFTYTYKVDFPKKVLYIDLTDLKPSKSLETIVEEAENTGAKQTLTIRGKYKHCVITIMFS